MDFASWFGALDSALCALINDNLLPFAAEILGEQSTWTFHQDNAPVHFTITGARGLMKMVLGLTSQTSILLRMSAE